MYGTIMRARVKPESRDEFERYMRDMAPPNETGFHAVQVGWEDKDPDRIVIVVFFKDKESYQRNAQDPDTNTSYEKMVEYLEGGVEWLDVNWSAFSGKPLTEEAGAPA